MIALKVARNNEEPVAVGLNPGVVTVGIGSSTQRQSPDDDDDDGDDDDGPADSYHVIGSVFEDKPPFGSAYLRWHEEALSVGDQVRIEVVDTNDVTTPRSVQLSHPCAATIGCLGAVPSALDEIDDPRADALRAEIQAIVDHWRPIVRAGIEVDPAAFMEERSR